MTLFEISNEMVSNGIASVILIVGILVLRSIAIKTIRHAKIPNSDIRRRLIVQAKNVAIILAILGLFLIWGSELKTFAVSVVAIAAAIVVATKELILCFLGGIMKAGSQIFRVGDRVEIAGLRGDVIDHSLFTTTLYEIGPGKEYHQFTGRVIVIPNSLIITSPIINETETGPYVLHVFKVSVPSSADINEYHHRLLEAAQIATEPYIADAQKQFDRLGKREGIESPSVFPRISLSFADEKRIDLVLRVAVPTRRKGRVEQEILSRYAGLAESSWQT